SLAHRGVSRTGFPPLMASAAGFTATAPDDDAPDDRIAPDDRAAADDPVGETVADAAAAIVVKNSLRFTICALPLSELLGVILGRAVWAGQAFNRSKPEGVHNPGRLFACQASDDVLMITIPRLGSGIICEERAHPG